MKVVLSALLFIASACWAGLQTDKITVTDLGNRWYEHDQFGTFYDANNSDWYYHFDHGWIYVNEWDNNGTWMYVPLADDNSIIENNSSLSQEVALGWMWSKAEHYPHLYNNELEEWLYFNKERNKSKYYCHELKKYLAENFILKTLHQPKIGNHWNLSFNDDYNKSTFSDLFPDIDSTYAGYWIVNIPKDELSLDDNWSNMIQSLLGDVDELADRKIKKLKTMKTFTA